MCGRFTLRSPLEQILLRFDLPDFPFEYEPSYNVAPTQSVLTIVLTKEGKKAALMRWGLIPPWSKGLKALPPLINARAETLSAKPLFKPLLNRKRCLIVADGFYEWKKENSTKTPYYITAENKRLFAFAGLWDLWHDKEGTPIPSCTIITAAANETILPLHNRMPLILAPQDEETWLAARSFESVQDLVINPKGHALFPRAVSKLVNSPRNNSPLCIEPAD